jgi:hypothetical protein
VLAPEQDPWFKETMYMNFGDLGVKVKELVDKYQVQTQNTQKVDTIGTKRTGCRAYSPPFQRTSKNLWKIIPSSKNWLEMCRSMLQ